MNKNIATHCPHMLAEGKSILSNGVRLDISTTSGQATCTGEVDQYIMDSTFDFFFLDLFVFCYLVAAGAFAGGCYFVFLVWGSCC